MGSDDPRELAETKIRVMVSIDITVMKMPKLSAVRPTGRRVELILVARSKRRRAAVRPRAWKTFA